MHCRSLMAAYELASSGYQKIQVLQGGFNEWERSGRYSLVDNVAAVAAAAAAHCWLSCCLRHMGFIVWWCWQHRMSCVSTCLQGNRWWTNTLWTAVEFQLILQDCRIKESPSNVPCDARAIVNRQIEPNLRICFKKQDSRVVKSLYVALTSD